MINITRYLFIMVCCTTLFGCQQNNGEKVSWPTDESSSRFPGREAETHPLEKAFQQAGMIDVHTLDTSIRVLLRYGTTDNFLGIDMFEGFNKCYLQPEVAERLVLAQQALQQIDKNLSLLVWDAARPRSVQQLMWDKVVPPPGVHKSNFVSNPRNGSLHNYGCAVDVTIVDLQGNELDMGTDFDYFGELAWPISEQKMLKKGKLTSQQIQNRELLRSVMRAGRFWNIQTEWWHFNAMRREVARERYPMVE